MARRGGLVTMRIVHTITKGDVGGAQTHVAELATAQVAGGDEVVVVAGTDGPAMARCRDAGVEVVIVPSIGASRSRLWQRDALAELRAALAVLHPDIVHAHSSNAGFLARVTARRDGYECVYTAHGWPFQRGAALRQRVLSLVGELIAGRLGAGVICLTDAEAERARRARVARRGRLWVIPNGVADVPPELRRRDRNAPAAFVMVARFAPPKLQREMVDVMATMLDLDWTLTFVGDGPEFDECRRHGDALLGSRVSFVGHRDDVPQVLAEHDVIVLWSRYEGMPISLLEGMRAGLCCVASDLPGVRALLGVPPAGLVAADADGLRSRIAGLLDDREALDDLGRRARQRFEAHYSARAMEARTRMVYEQVLGRGGASTR